MFIIIIIKILKSLFTEDNIISFIFNAYLTYSPRVKHLKLKCMKNEK